MSNVPFFLEHPNKLISSIYFQTKLKGGNRLRLSLGVSVESKFWDNKKYRVRIRKEYPEHESINQQLESWEILILDVLDNFKTKLIVPTNETFKHTIVDRLTALNNNINNVQSESEGITTIFYDLLEERRVVQRRKDAIKVVIRAFRRFELYKNRSYTLSSVSDVDISQFEKFLAEEHILYKNDPKLAKIFEKVPDSKTPAQRGKNRVTQMLKILRSLFNQAIQKKLITHTPFADYNLNQEVYGTPYYITIEERDLLYKIDLSKRPVIAVQRDIFIFQCFIGCRVGDLMKMKKDNIIDGSIQYIARKTKDEHPVTVIVPLSKTAEEIIKRYSKEKGDKLLPFINTQDYNDCIKAAFTQAKLTRMVTFLDPETREEVRKPLNEVASSHLARRTFIGNLYKKIKDPSIIGSMSGHVEGSKAFSRYRTIDTELKKSIIDEHLQ